MPDYGAAEVIVAPTNAQQSELVRNAEFGDVNIFSGISAYPMVNRAFKECTHTKGQIGVISEAGRWSGVKGALRIVHARLDSLRYEGKVSFVLAIGHLGESWFRWVGYPREKVFRYGYFVDTPAPTQSTVPQRTVVEGPFRLVFIGQLVRRKGVHLLLHALRALAGREWVLDVIGDGVESRALAALARQFGIIERVKFHGALDNALAMQLLGHGDVLVLPSEWDGWGAVVNEALMRGVPVICSDKCGAADLIVDSYRGHTFRASDVGELKRCLLEHMQAGKPTPGERRRLVEWSRVLDGASAASYMVNVIHAAANGGQHPTPPWLPADRIA